MRTPTPSPPHAPMAVPMGFAAQIRALQESQREQAERIANLERDNAELKTVQDTMRTLLARIEALEQHNAYLKARRREAVGQLLNLRTLHQEADNAFHVRTLDIQPDDLEGILGVYGTLITTVMIHHQRAIGHLRANGQLSTNAASVCQAAPQVQHPFSPTPICYAYPAAYTQAGYCRAHNVPYWCRVCGQ